MTLPRACRVPIYPYLTSRPPTHLLLSRYRGWDEHLISLRCTPYISTLPKCNGTLTHPGLLGSLEPVRRRLGIGTSHRRASPIRLPPASFRTPVDSPSLRTDVTVSRFGNCTRHPGAPLDVDTTAPPRPIRGSDTSAPGLHPVVSRPRRLSPRGLPRGPQHASLTPPVIPSQAKGPTAAL